MRSWEYYYNQGIACKLEGKLDKSAEYHLKVLELEPELAYPEAWHNAGAALLRIERKEEAQPYLERALREYNNVLEEGENRAYYFFWKACVYALLEDKKNMLFYLEQSLRLDNAFAQDAQFEENLKLYRNDKDFRNLLDPFLKIQEMLTFRGKSMNRTQVSTTQLNIRNVFMHLLESQGWQKDNFFTDSFDFAEVSPQAMFEYCQNDDFCLRLSLHLDTKLIFFELWNRLNEGDIKLFRLYYEEDKASERVKSIAGAIANQKDAFNLENWAENLKAVMPYCREVQMQLADGMRVKLS